MRPFAIITVVTFMALTPACSRHTTNMDPLKPAMTAVAFQRECTKEDDDGNCLQASCKADADSDCNVFAAGCVRSGHHYSGSAEGGLCTVIL